MNAQASKFFGNLLLRLALLAAAVLPLAGQAQVLWSVQGQQGQQNWLLGTVHSEDPRLLEFSPELLEALQQSRRLALELVPDLGMLEVLSAAMRLPEPGLDRLLDGELYRQLVQIMEAAYGMGEPAVRELQPWAAAMTISVPPARTGLFMDLALAVRARSLGLAVVALERLEEQLAFLADMPEPMQIEMLRHSVAEFPRQGEWFEALLETYLAGDLGRLQAVTQSQMRAMSPELLAHFEQIGMIQRNHVMVERALPFLEEGGVMIAVGALHLPGEQGLIALLAGHGFDLQPAGQPVVAGSPGLAP